MYDMIALAVVFLILFVLFYSLKLNRDIIVKLYNLDTKFTDLERTINIVLNTLLEKSKIPNIPALNSESEIVHTSEPISTENIKINDPGTDDNISDEDNITL